MKPKNKNKNKNKKTLKAAREHRRPTPTPCTVFEGHAPETMPGLQSCIFIYSLPFRGGGTAKP
jgi:hypothetical protein